MVCDVLQRSLIGDVGLSLQVSAAMEGQCRALGQHSHSFKGSLVQVLHRIMSAETDYLSVQQGDRVALLVNSLGFVMPSELHIAARAAIRQLQETFKASQLFQLTISVTLSKVSVTAHICDRMPQQVRLQPAVSDQSHTHLHAAARGYKGPLSPLHEVVGLVRVSFRPSRPSKAGILRGSINPTPC